MRGFDKKREATGLYQSPLVIIIHAILCLIVISIPPCGGFIHFPILLRRFKLSLYANNQSTSNQSTNNRNYTEKLSPQPQVRAAFGLLK